MSLGLRSLHGCAVNTRTLPPPAHTDGAGSMHALWGNTRQLQLWLWDAPQLSVHVNQMIVQAKHHGCNSRIDKCCSLRLIQRHAGIKSGVALLVVYATLWVCSSRARLVSTWVPCRQWSAYRVCVCEGWQLGLVGPHAPRSHTHAPMVCYEVNTVMDCHEYPTIVDHAC